MRCLIGLTLLLLASSGCANQLALSELSARNTVPPPGTQNRMPGGGNGYYNPLALFQSSSGNTTSFTPTAPAGGFASTPRTPTASSETASPFWNLPTAPTNTPAQPAFNDRWASRGSIGSSNSATGSPFNSISAGTRPIDIPPPQLPGFGGTGSSNSSPNTGFGNAGIGNPGFGTSAPVSRPPFGFGGTSNTGMQPGNYNSNSLGTFFNQLWGGLTNTQAPNTGNQPRRNFSNTNQQLPSAGFTTRAPTPSAPAPRFDFGAPRASSDGSEPAVKISDSALRELPRNSKSTTPSADTTRSAVPPATPLVRQPTTPPNALPASPATSRPLRKQDSEYIEISRLPPAPTSAT